MLNFCLTDFSFALDRIIAIGSHHDAWVMGAVDPCSGASVLMEIVRAVGVAVKKGRVVPLDIQYPIHRRATREGSLASGSLSFSTNKQKCPFCGALSFSERAFL